MTPSQQHKSAPRQKALRDRRRAKGLKTITRYVLPEHIPLIDAYIEKLKGNKMKYQVQNEQYETVKTLEASDIYEAADMMDNGGEEFSVFNPGSEKEHAYNGEFKISRAFD
jgi:hypothetical protein